MTSRSAAVYGLGGVLLVACLAAANMPQDRDAAPPRAPRETRPAGPDALAIEVNSQASRLRAMIAHAPVPGASARNPFSFGGPRAPKATAPALTAVASDPPPVLAAPLPPLTLMGVAEDMTSQGTRRTAVIGGDGDTIYMVVEGDPVGDRYRVRKIGADAIELEDLVSKGLRRLALR
jgi:hypothetical protein